MTPGLIVRCVRALNKRENLKIIRDVFLFMI